ncbi:MAG: twin-arginine translocase subunit TatC [Bacteroidales bacterium]|nr:twin-arginine translocase subunit TatC [Candidatus Cacconaster merdequi]
MASSGEDKTFWEHIDDLRKVLFRSAGVLVVLMMVVFCFKSFLFDTLLLAPLSSDFILYRGFNAMLEFFGLSPLADFRINMINVEMTAQFFMHIRISFYIALVVAMPVVVYFLWTFIRPALYDNERRAVQKSFGFAALLFYVGVAVGYLLVFPLTIRFLGTYQVSESVPNQISLSSYFGMMISLVLIMGIVFEMPILAALLSRFGIISKQWLKKYRRHAVVVLVAVAAVITPSGDPVTLFFVSVPLYALYELSIAVARPADEDDEDDEVVTVETEAVE